MSGTTIRLSPSPPSRYTALMPRLYDNLVSGNGYKCRLLLAKNANGRIPLLELDDGRRLAESDAILWYLADGTPYLPEDKFERAQVLQWMFFEQYSHEPY